MAHLRPFATARTTAQKRSRSSILKRTLNDDDMVPDDFYECNGPSGVVGGGGGSRPKRVSFARTYKLKEFIKESDMLTLRSNDATGGADQLAIVGVSIAQTSASSSGGAAAAVSGSGTLCDSVAMEITTMASAATVDDAAGSPDLHDNEDDFSAFLAAHDDPPQQQHPPQTDADIEDNNSDDSEDEHNDHIADEEARLLRRQRCASRLVGQMHHLLQHELGERILPMPNYSDTSSSESLKMATAAAFAAVAIGASSSSGSSMTMITSSSSATATVSQHFYQAYQQPSLHHQHHHHRQHLQGLSSTRCTTADLAPFEESISHDQHEHRQKQRAAPSAGGGGINDSVLERCRELEELFHTACTAVSPCRGASVSTAAAAAAADSSMLALERSLFGGTASSDSMSIVTATVCQPSAMHDGGSADVSIDKDGDTAVNEDGWRLSDASHAANLTCVADSGDGMMLDVASRESLSASGTSKAATIGDNADNPEVTSFMSLSTGRSPESRGPLLSAVATPSLLRSASPPTVGMSPFRRLFQPAASAASPLLPLLGPQNSETLDEVMQRASDNLLPRAGSSCFAGCDGDSVSIGDELFAGIRQVCDRLPPRLKRVLLDRLLLERERCQVDIALGSLQYADDVSSDADEATLTALYRRRLGEVASRIVAHLLPEILEGIRARSLSHRWPREQLMRLRSRGRQLYLEKSRSLMAADLDAAIAEASVERTLMSSKQRRRSAQHRREFWLTTPPTAEERCTPGRPLFTSVFVAECALSTVQYTVSEDPPSVVLKYLHSRLHINCRVLLGQQGRRADKSLLAGSAQRDAADARADADAIVRVQGFSCSVWKDGCTGPYAQFLPLFSSTAELLRDSLSYCCKNMQLDEFEQRAYDIVKPAYLLLLDLIRLRLTPCQVHMECLGDKAVAFSFVAMSRIESGDCRNAGSTGPRVYRVRVCIALPDIGRFFSADGAPAGNKDFSVRIEQREFGGLFDLADSVALTARLEERVSGDRRRPLTAAYAACREFLDSC